MKQWFITTFPNVVYQGWNGNGGWLTALNETFFMTFWSAIFGGILGLIFGICLVVFDKDGILPNKTVYNIFDKIVSLFRAIPFVILLAFIAPVTQKIVGTQIGTTAALVPLSVGVFPFYARQVQVALKNVDSGTIEAAQSLGSTTKDIIFDVYLKEALPELIRVSTVTLISLVGLTAMAGAIGAGGLGNMAIAYGYNRFASDVTLFATIAIVIIIFLIQWIGDALANHVDHVAKH